MIQSNKSIHPNILLVIADDFGLDTCPNYPEGTVKPNMPNLEQLMEDGLTFDNFWCILFVHRPALRL